MAGVADQRTIDGIASSLPIVLAADNDETREKCRERDSWIAAVVPSKKDWNAIASEGPVRLDQPRHGMDADGLQGLLQRHRRKDPQQAPGHHGLSKPGTPTNNRLSDDDMIVTQ